MNNSLSGLSKAILGIMVVIVLICGGVVFSIRGMEKAIAPIRNAKYVPRESVEKSAFLIHGFWVFDQFDNSDYLGGSFLDSLLKVSAIEPKADDEPGDYNASRFYSCNYVPDAGQGYYYWASFREISDAATFKATVSSLSRMYPFSLISDRYIRYYNDEQYDKANRSRFCKIFGLPDPNHFSPVIIMDQVRHFSNDTETPGVDSELDGFTVKYVDRNRLVLTYRDVRGKLDLVYKNADRLPGDILPYSVYFKGVH